MLGAFESGGDAHDMPHDEVSPPPPPSPLPRLYTEVILIAHVQTTASATMMVHMADVERSCEGAVEGLCCGAG